MINLIDNRQIRIFISSTFRDMMRERDYLITKVFPVLKKYCEERDVTLFELDLRWGISEEEAKQSKVVDICLHEIENTRPFFIGLLGERYGWIPTKQELAASETFNDYNWINADVSDGLSITEMEMQYGVLRSEDDMNAYFYFRSPEMPTPDEFREKPDSPEAQKLIRLKTKINAQKKYPVQTYSSVEDLGDRVEKDFKALVDRLFPHGAMSELEKERLQQTSFLKRCTGTYIASQENYDALNDFIESDEQYFVVTGESGLGKSALIANWIKKYETQHLSKLIYHFIGNSNAEGDYHKISQRLIDEIKAIYDLADRKDDFLMAANKNDDEKDKQKEELTQLLLQIATKEPLLIVLDGVNQLADLSDVKLMNWLPAFPQNVKVIFSTTNADATMDTFKRRRYTTHTLQPLTQAQRKNLIVDYLKSFGKSLLPEQIERIVSNKEMENTMILRTLLDELRVFGVHEQIGEQISRYLAAPDIPAFFDLVLQRLENDYVESKPNDVFSLIAVSQAGLSETEIKEITGIQPLYWAQLYSVISSFLVPKNGLLSFTHSFLQVAVWKRYLQDKKETENNYRKRIVEYCEKQERSKRIFDELSHQYYELHDLDKLYNYVLNFEVFDYLLGRKNILYKYWKIMYDTDTDRYSIMRYVEKKGQEDVLPEQLANAMFKYATFLYELRYYEEALPLYEKCLSIRRKLTEDNDAYLPDFVDTLSHLAHLYSDTNQLSQAESHYEKVLKIYRDLAGEKNKICVSGVEIEIPKDFYLSIACKAMEANILNSLGLLHFKTNKLDKAEKEYNEALEILKERIATNPDDDNLSGLANTLCNLAWLYKKTTRFDQAESHYEKALKIYRDLTEKNPDTYEPVLLEILNQFACLYVDCKQFDRAEVEFNEVLKIREKLAAANPDVYLPVLADTLNNLGDLYQRTEKFNQANTSFEKALKIYKDLAKKNPDAYSLFVVTILDNLDTIPHEQINAYYRKRMDNLSRNLDSAGLWRTLLIFVCVIWYGFAGCWIKLFYYLKRKVNKMRVRMK